MKYLVIILRIVTGILFGAAGWYSLKSADFTEYAFVDWGITGWSLAPYLFRTLAGTAIAIGTMLALHLGRGRKFKILSIAFAVFMLIYQIVCIDYLELDRCYLCLGEFQRDSISQGLILWSAVILMLIPVYFRDEKLRRVRFLPLWQSLGTILALAIPFIINYPPSWAIYGEKAEMQIDIDLKPEVAARIPVIKGNIQQIKIGEGSQIVCFATLNCPYCKRLAYRLHIMRKQHPDFPVTLVLEGDTADLPGFIQRTRLGNVPYALIYDNWFVECSGGSFPKVYMSTNGKAHTRYSYWALNNKHVKYLQSN